MNDEYQMKQTFEDKKFIDMGEIKEIKICATPEQFWTFESNEKIQINGKPVPHTITFKPNKKK